MAGETNRSKTPRGRVFNTKADDMSAREVRADSEHRRAARPSEETSSRTRGRSRNSPPSSEGTTLPARSQKLNQLNGHFRPHH